MSTPTLDGMTVEQLRDLAKRAEAIAANKVKEREEKDIVPPVGAEWEYNGRYWVTAMKGDCKRVDYLLLSIPKGGGVIRGWWVWEKFSEEPPPRSGGWTLGDVSHDDVLMKYVAKLALRVRDA